MSAWVYPDGYAHKGWPLFSTYQGAIGWGTGQIFGITGYGWCAGSALYQVFVIAHIDTHMLRSTKGSVSIFLPWLRHNEVPATTSIATFAERSSRITRCYQDEEQSFRFRFGSGVNAPESSWMVGA